MELASPSAAVRDAAAAARGSRHQSQAIGGREVLVFRLGREHYGIDILNVQEIRGYAAPTRLAGAPDTVQGVLDLRGRIVPIVDLRLMFGVQGEVTSLTVTIVLSVCGRTVGIVADAVSDVIELDTGAVRPAPRFEDVGTEGFVEGLITVGQASESKLLTLLDIQRLIRSAAMGGWLEQPL